MVATLVGERSWEGERDDEGHRTWKVVSLVVTNSVNDGPQTVMNCPGLRQIGDIYQFGNDIDAWAFCTPRMVVRRHGSTEGEPDFWWTVEQTFATQQRQRCQEVTIENPLDEPVRVGGSFVKYVREATHDRFGNLILNSAQELIKGPQVEFDVSHPTVWVEQNVAFNELNVFAQLIDCLNGHPLWGLPPRTIKLSNIVWERMYFGVCNIFYKRTFEFDIQFEGFDRQIADEGTRVRVGDWVRAGGALAEPFRWKIKTIPTSDMAAKNVQMFQQYKDVRGEPTTVILDGNGCPWNPLYNPITGDPWDPNNPDNPDPDLVPSPGKITVEKYPDANFLVLNLPLFL